MPTEFPRSGWNPGESWFPFFVPDVLGGCERKKAILDYLVNFEGFSSWKHLA